jgi:hypothetical protein
MDSPLRQAYKWELHKISGSCLMWAPGFLAMAVKADRPDAISTDLMELLWSLLKRKSKWRWIEAPSNELPRRKLWGTRGEKHFL